MTTSNVVTVDEQIVEVPLLDRDIEELKQDPEYVAEYAAIGFMEDICGLMENQGISRADLAQRMGVSRAYVTRLFDAPPNLTLTSLAKLALALEATLEVSIREK